MFYLTNLWSKSWNIQLIKETINTCIIYKDIIYFDSYDSNNTYMIMVVSHGDGSECQEDEDLHVW